MSTNTSAEIYIDVTINSAHRLPHVSLAHRCVNMHGHDFRIRLAWSGPVLQEGEGDLFKGQYKTEAGMVADYDRLLSIWQPLHEQLDHRVLNDVEGLENPTCENLAIWILRRTPDWVCRVEVSTTLPVGRAGCVVRRVDLAADS